MPHGHPPALMAQAQPHHAQEAAKSLPVFWKFPPPPSPPNSTAVALNSSPGINPFSKQPRCLRPQAEGVLKGGGKKTPPHRAHSEVFVYLFKSRFLPPQPAQGCSVEEGAISARQSPPPQWSPMSPSWAVEATLRGCSAPEPALPHNRSPPALPQETAQEWMHQPFPWPGNTKPNYCHLLGAHRRDIFIFIYIFSAARLPTGTTSSTDSSLPPQQEDSTLHTPSHAMAFTISAAGEGSTAGLGTAQHCHAGDLPPSR